MRNGLVLARRFSHAVRFSAILIALGGLATDAPWRLAGIDPAGASSHAPMVRELRPDGQVLRGSRNEITSRNWSGYEVANGPYTSAQGTWTVPAVHYAPYAGSPDVEVSSTWVGIGGQSPDTTLIQLGTQQQVTSAGVPTYFAWYEILPGAEVPLGNRFPVSAGDTITASLRCTAACTPGSVSTWILAMTNARWPAPFQITLQYRSSMATAEWVMEATCLSDCLSSNAFYSYLPNFGSVAFNGIAANGSNPNLSLAQNGIVMHDPSGGATSTPSAAVGGNSFTVGFSDPSHPPPPPPSDYTYTPLAVSDSGVTYSYGINDAGLIVGQVGTSGFIYAGGDSATIYTVNGAEFTYLYGINSSGTTSGTYGARTGDGTPVVHAFYAESGTNSLTAVDAPGATYTYGRGINAAGHVVGYFFQAGVAHARGFLFDGRNYKTIEVPGTTGDTQVWGINDSDQVVGVYWDNNHIAHGFLYGSGTFTILNGPDTAQDAAAYGVNNAGEVVGSYRDRNGKRHGFLYRAGQYRPLDAPSGTATWAAGINSGGHIVGWFTTPRSATYGFLADPAGSGAGAELKPLLNAVNGPRVTLTRQN
jgi:probable HAF family extracellular repeat protein